MVEDRVKRAEERPSLTHIFGLAQRPAGLVQPAIGPGVVMRKRRKIAARHGGPPGTTPSILARCGRHAAVLRMTLPRACETGHNDGDERDHYPAGAAGGCPRHCAARYRYLAYDLCWSALRLLSGRIIGTAPRGRLAQRHPTRTPRRPRGCGFDRRHSRLWQLRAKSGRALFRRRGVHALCRPGLAESRDWATPVDRAVSTPCRNRAPFRNPLGTARQSSPFLL